ncbi:hypothetical protein FQZ97_1041870 [compost metagenome]
MRTSTPAKNGLMRDAATGMGTPSSGGANVAAAKASAAGSAGVCPLRNSKAVHRSTDLPSWTMSNATVRALVPSRSTVNSSVIGARLAGRQKSKLNRATSRPRLASCAWSARTSSAAVALPCRASADHGPMAASVGTKRSPSLTNTGSPTGVVMDCACTLTTPRPPRS